VPPHATVLRGGVASDVMARELVPGDIVLIGSGDRCAHCIKLQCIQFTTCSCTKSALCLPFKRSVLCCVCDLVFDRDTRHLLHVCSSVQHVFCARGKLCAKRAAVRVVIITLDETALIHYVQYMSQDVLSLIDILCTPLRCALLSNRVPADCRIIQATELMTDDSSLTG
jgi:magnesium-transporting ATPase (P-type)